MRPASPTEYRVKEGAPAPVSWPLLHVRAPTPRVRSICDAQSSSPPLRNKRCVDVKPPLRPAERAKYDSSGTRPIYRIPLSPNLLPLLSRPTRAGVAQPSRSPQPTAPFARPTTTGPATNLGTSRLEWCFVRGRTPASASTPPNFPYSLYILRLHFKYTVSSSTRHICRGTRFKRIVLTI